MSNKQEAKSCKRKLGSKEGTRTGMIIRNSSRTKVEVA